MYNCFKRFEKIEEYVYVPRQSFRDRKDDEVFRTKLTKKENEYIIKNDCYDVEDKILTYRYLENRLKSIYINNFIFNCCMEQGFTKLILTAKNMYFNCIRVNRKEVQNNRLYLKKFLHKYRYYSYDSDKDPYTRWGYKEVNYEIGKEKFEEANIKISNIEDYKLYDDEEFTYIELGEDYYKIRKGLGSKKLRYKQDKDVYKDEYNRRLKILKVKKEEMVRENIDYIVELVENHMRIANEIKERRNKYRCEMDYKDYINIYKKHFIKAVDNIDLDMVSKLRNIYGEDDYKIIVKYINTYVFNSIKNYKMRELLSNTYKRTQTGGEDRYIKLDDSLDVLQLLIARYCDKDNIKNYSILDIDKLTKSQVKFITDIGAVIKSEDKYNYINITKEDLPSINVTYISEKLEVKRNKTTDKIKRIWDRLNKKSGVI
ncbi:hypothetical protein [Clostridium cylindrosporum]|uniref:hypothetical protein n=1 Tax=Clostridium cylindrosporum TaxID=1495 RepID=UPI00128BBB17|nr:hypothetical protein [Clostridium cylindrosporum]